MEVDIHFTEAAASKALPMINCQMSIVTKNQCIIASKFINMNNRTSSHRFDRQVKNAFNTDISQNLYFQPSLSFQNAENRDFIASSPASDSPPFRPQIGFIGLNLPSEKPLFIAIISCEGMSQRQKSFKDFRRGEPQLLGGSSSRDLQFKDLKQPKPIPKRDFNPINPSSGEVGKFIATLRGSDSENVGGDAISCLYMQWIQKRGPFFQHDFLLILSISLLEALNFLQ
jgi:hypothetical protein